MCCTGFHIQSDWDKAIEENEKSIWFHYYNSGKVKYHRLVKCESYFTPDNDFYTCRLFSPRLLQLQTDGVGPRTTFQSPDITLDSVYPQKKPPQVHLSCMDVSPSGELIISAASDQTIHVFEAETGSVRRNLSGHVGEIYSCRFFPSGMAALTSSADMQLKIWCLKTGVCAATLAPGCGGAVTGVSNTKEPGGHCSGVLDTGIIDRGRNIVAIDRLGWLRLWDVSTQICLSAIPLVPNAFNNRRLASSPLEECVCLAIRKQNNYKLPLVEDNGLNAEGLTQACIESCSTTSTEVGTNDCLVAVGMGTRGAVQLYDLSARSRGCVLRVSLPENSGSVEACTFPISLSPTGHRRHSTDGADSCASSGHSSVDESDEFTSSRQQLPESLSAVEGFVHYGLVAGGQTGEVAAWDLRFPNRVLLHMTGEKSAAHHLRAYTAGEQNQLNLMVARSDGRVIVHSIDPGLCATATVDGGGAGGPCDKPEDSSARTLELTGIDCEPVAGLSVSTGGGGGSVRVWTASHGGCFRCYRRLATDIAFADPLF